MDTYIENMCNIVRYMYEHDVNGVGILKIKEEFDGVFQLIQGHMMQVDFRKQKNRNLYA